MKIIEKKKKYEYLASFVFMLIFFSLRREYKCLNFQCFVFFPFEMEYLKCVNWLLPFIYLFIVIYYFFMLIQEIKIYFLFISESESRDGCWCVFTMYSKYIGCHFLHPFRMDCWNSWCTNGFPYSIFILCCCKFNYFENHL